MALTEEQISEIKLSFKRCNEATVQAILRYRETKDIETVAVIVSGIIERYMPPESADRFRHATDDTRISEDLGIDSLTMLEIVLSIEEAIDLHIEDSELRPLKTLGDVKNFLRAKLTGETGPTTAVAAVSASKKYSQAEVLKVIPQQPPFLFVDSAEIEGDLTRASYRIRGDEDFLKGHFPGDPTFPASIVFEALGQAGCLWVVENVPARLNLPITSKEVLFASLDGAHFFKRSRPGDVLDFEIKLIKLRAPLAIFSGLVKNQGQRVAQIDKLILAFGEEPEDPQHAMMARDF
jgi:3-hydroxyacyl-[acyl-carrier-protein] dehydratase